MYLQTHCITVATLDIPYFLHDFLLINLPITGWTLEFRILYQQTLSLTATVVDSVLK